MHIVWRDTAEPAAYEAARLDRVFNQRAPSRFPVAVVQATSEDDVIAAVQLASQHKTGVSVRSGGHSFPVWGLQDEAILVDLGPFRQLVVDEQKRTAVVSPSITSEELNAVLIEQHGLMFPGGHCPDVGLGGFLLQGGMGWNCRNWGWACERVNAVDVVTARGEVIRCDAEQNPDMYWVARGAGPAFPGIVVRFHLSLIPFSTEGLRSSGYIYPRRLFRQAFAWALQITPELDVDMEITVKSYYSEEHRDVCILVHFICMKSTPEESDTALRPLSTTRPPGTLTEWSCQKDTMDNLYDKQAKASPKGHRYYTENAFLRNDADFMSVLENAFLDLPHRKTFAFWSAMNPFSRGSRQDMALDIPSDHYFAIYAIWEAEEDDERCKTAVRTVMKGVEGHSVGAYMGDSDLENGILQFWAPDKARKLVEIAQRWDSGGRFCRYRPILKPGST